MVLGDPQQPKKIRLQSLKTTGPKGRVRVLRRHLRGKGKETRDMEGAGGLGGIGASLETTQQGKRRSRGIFLSHSP
jgi:hypothetical protein